MGIEVGYHKYKKNEYEMFCWATIIDEHKHQVSGQSYKFILPEYHQKILYSGKYLCDYLDNYSKKSKDPVVVYIDNMIRYRKPFIESAIKDVLVKYLKKEDFNL